LVYFLSGLKLNAPKDIGLCAISRYDPDVEKFIDGGIACYVRLEDGSMEFFDFSKVMLMTDIMNFLLANYVTKLEHYVNNSGNAPEYV
jgi:hypothetical protein